MLFAQQMFGKGQIRAMGQAGYKASNSRMAAALSG